MATTRRGSSVKKGLKFFLYGQQGTRKSTFALQFMKMQNELGRPLRVFYVDTEYGSIDNYLESLEEEGVNLDNLFIIYANTYSELEEWLEKAINDEEIYTEDDNGDSTLVLDADGNPFKADVIVVDSVTPVQDTLKYSMIQTSEKRAKLKAQKKDGATASEIFVAESTAGMEFKDFDKLNHKGKNLLRSLITRTNKYVCVTSREADKKEQVKDGKGVFTSVKVGVKPDCFKGAEYEFFTVLRMFEDEDSGEIKAQIERKDRTMLFQQGEIIENPTPELWQEIISRNAGKRNNIVVSEKYDESLDKEEEAMYKAVKVNSKSTPSASTEDDIDIENPSMVNAKIRQLRESMSPLNKKNLSAQFTKAGLPKQPTDDLEVSVLLEMLEVAKNMSK